MASSAPGNAPDQNEPKTDPNTGMDIEISEENAFINSISKRIEKKRLNHAAKKAKTMTNLNDNTNNDNGAQT